MQGHRIENSLKKTMRTFVNLLPIIVGMLLLTSLAVAGLPKQISAEIFGGNDALNALIGASVGSMAVGHPLASYLLGGELLAGGISLIAVTALIVSWVTVGLIQLPAEMLLLGKRFAIVRNITCYVLAIAVACLTVYTFRLFG